MPRKLAKFSADDVFRALSGAKRAGINIERCEVSAEGHIVLICDSRPGCAKEVEPETSRPETALERWLADENAR